MACYQWISTCANSNLPCSAVEGGVDSDGSTIYVGKAFHEGAWIPAKVIPRRKIAYVPYNKTEHEKNEFQVLCGQRFRWVQSCGGQCVNGAVPGGRTSKGETLYIGRVRHNCSLTVGKVHPSHGLCYIPYGGKEHSYSNYEILVSY